MRLAEDVADLGIIEQSPQQDGRNMTMLLAPVKRKPEQEPVAEQQPVAEAPAQAPAEAPAQAPAEAPADARAAADAG
jgi:translation initiation factor IF-3